MNNVKAIAESSKFVVLDKYTQEGKATESYQSEGDLEREAAWPLTAKEGAPCPSI